jgi:hypothetical protein
MDTQSQPADLSLQLPRDVYRVVVYTLRGLLPPPEADTPEAEARRDRAAIARVASMLPANDEEADLAARCVAHAAYAMDCLRLARGYRATDHAYFLKCTAQAASTERKAQSARSLLLRLQAERRKRQADNAAADQDAWTEHCAIGMMADALGDASPEAPAEAPPPPPPAPQPAEEPVPDPVAEADRYAVIYPQRAARIRALGGLPQPCGFGPPPPELVDAIVTGTSPTLRALEKV